MKNIEVFCNLKAETYKKLEKVVKLKHVNKKEILFLEREIVDKVYFLKEGKVSILKLNENGERKIIFILRNNQMINEVLIEHNRSSTVSCEAFEDSLVFECDSKDLLEIMESDFQLTKNILSHTQHINKRLYRQLKNSISIKIDKKLAVKLYRMAIEFGVQKGEWTLIDVNLTITYIADMLGCKRETLSRAMKILQEKDLVKMENKKMLVRKEELCKYFKAI